MNSRQEEIREWLEHNFHETNARVILDYLHSQGVVIIDTDRKLPAYTSRGEPNNLVRLGFAMARRDIREAGWKAVSPLIEEE